MGLIERIEQQMRAPQMKHPLGGGSSVDPLAAMLGAADLEMDSRKNPKLREDYIATSNDVYSVISLRARMLSRLQLGTFNGRGSKKTEITSGPATDLLRHVNPFWTWPRLLRMDELSMGIWGESFWAIHKGPLGEPREIWWMKASRVRPVPDATGYIKGYLYETVGGDPVAFSADEVVWFRYPNPIDEFQALSPLAAARLAADTASAMQKANKNLFDQGLMAGGIVVPATDKVTFAPEQAEELEKMLDRRLRGVDKAHRWSVLRFEAQMKGLNVTPKDAEFANGMNMTLRQVCNAYGMPAPLLNEMSAATLSNVREYERQAWDLALAPDADFKAAEIEEQLLPMFARTRGRQTVDHVEWDYSGVPALQESATAAWAREAQAIDRGALTINEWRESKGMKPVPWGDVYWAPVNKAPVEDGEETPAATSAPKPASTPEDVQDFADGLAVKGVYQTFEALTANLELAGYSRRNGHSKER